MVLAALLTLALTPLASAQDARTSALNDVFPSVDAATFQADADQPLFLSGDLGTVATPEAFFRDHAGAFGFDAAPDVRVVRTESDDLGLTHIRVQQTVGGVPVFGAESALHLRDGRAYAWGGDLHPGAVNVRTTPALDAATSIQAAQRALGPVEYRRASGDAPLTGREAAADWAPRAELVVLPHDGDYVLTYHVRLFVEAPTPANWEVFVDATTGEVVHRFNSIHTFDPRAEADVAAWPGVPYAAPSASTMMAGPTTGTGSSLYSGTVTIPTYLSGSSYYLYDTTRGPSYIRTMTGNNGTSLPGSYITDSDNNFTATAARAGVDAHYGAVATFDYFKNTHNRNSYNGNNASITSTVHHRSGYNNAFWNGSQMVYGDGDGSTFGPLVELDIAAHELSHAVTEYTGGLIYQNESGALNEAFSDIMAIMVDRNDYRVGENSYTPGTSGDALRYLDNPPAGNQPDNYADRYTGSQDNGGVHINSGIANKQAYLMIAGGTFRGVTVGAVGRSVTEKVWYRAMANYFTSSTNFAGARAGTIQAATDLYGAGSSQVASVTNAWAAVGVGSTSGGGGGGGGGGTPEWRYETITYQSPHNYPNNYNNTQTYSKPGAQRVAMYFEQFSTENNYDYVYIKDGSGSTTATYTGNKSAFWAIVDDDAISVNLVTDYSVTAYGYRVTTVAYYSDQVLLAADPNPVLGYEPEAQPSDVLPAVLAKAEVAELALGVGPNPAGATTTATISLPDAGPVSVTVIDLLGRTVATPLAGTLEAGQTPVRIDTSDLPAGVYVVVLDAAGQRLTRQVTVVR